MLRPTLKNSIAALFGVAVTAQLISIAGTYAGETGGSSASSAVEQESGRRLDYTRGEAALRGGLAAYREKDFETAVSQYKLACDLIPNSSNTAELYAEAINGFSKASCRFAEQRIAEGRWVDAQNQLKLLLDARYNPSCREAVALLARLESQTLGPKFRFKVDEVKRLLIEAQGLYEKGSYDMAMKRYDQVLVLDPYNIAAREGQSQINHRVVQGVSMRPVRNFNLVNESIGATGPISAKLQRIIIPRLEFREATIREAVEFLRKKSIELDTAESDPARRGINFVLKLDSRVSAAGASAQRAISGPEPMAISGLDPNPGAAPSASEAPSAPGDTPDNTPITISLKNIPLSEALKYVTSLANLKYKIEAEAVLIVPAGTECSELIQKQYKLPPNFFSRGSAPGDVAGGGIAAQVNVSTALKSSGVTFPEGATAIYVPATSTLTVRNTKENLDLIDALVTNNQ